ncbi:hypothetical protein RA279_27940, partial [Pseudomonas syringae pv. tagetis]|uniref:hypothetical protein n=1 Tax=Pseudomonas syringae group genomosp. 7 TaxID=251699 RepID=UPI0037705ADC
VVCVVFLCVGVCWVFWCVGVVCVGGGGLGCVGGFWGVFGGGFFVFWVCVGVGLFGGLVVVLWVVFGVVCLWGGVSMRFFVGG